MTQLPLPGIPPVTAAERAWARWRRAQASRRRIWTALRRRCTIPKEHDPLDCRVCPQTGDWANTPDTEDFLARHSKAGYEFKVEGGRLIELLAPASPCRQVTINR